MSWLTRDYPFNGDSGGGGVPGTIPNVPADGSAVVTVTLPSGIVFANAISSVVLTVQGSGASPLDPQVVPGSMTANTFQVVCVGGTGTVTLNYVAYGS